MRDDRLLLDFFSKENADPISGQEKWWVGGAICVVAAELAFALVVFLTI